MCEIPSRKYHDDVIFVCKITGKEKIEIEFGHLVNEDVVLTNERLNHINFRRGNDANHVINHMEKQLKSMITF